MAEDWQPTACILCECNCGIEVQLEGGTLRRIRGDRSHPGSRGYTCNKALRLDLYQNGPHRLTSPLRRAADGGYEEIDWDTAIEEIGAGFKRLAEAHGGESIFYYGGGGQGNHLGGAYSGAFLKALGSTHRANALGQEKTGDGWIDAQLYGGHTRGEFAQAVDEYEDDFAYISHPDKKIALEIPQMLAATRALIDAQPGHTSAAFPLVLSVGERRSYTANDIFRNPDWRKRDSDGALRVSVEDAAQLGLADGGRARITTVRGSAEASVEISESMMRGHASLPNGYGLDFTDPSGDTTTRGVAPNSLTSSDWRDEFAGTPWHKHVPARVEALT